MWELNRKEVWTLKNWWFQTVVLEKTPESLLDWKENKPLNPKGSQPWIFIGRTVAEVEAEALATWWEETTHWKRLWWWERLRQGEKGVTGDEMIGWHHQLNGHKEGGKPCVLQSMESQTVRHDFATEQQHSVLQNKNKNLTTTFLFCRTSFLFFNTFTFLWFFF